MGHWEGCSLDHQHQRVSPSINFGATGLKIESAWNHDPVNAPCQIWFWELLYICTRTGRRMGSDTRPFRMAKHVRRTFSTYANGMK